MKTASTALLLCSALALAACNAPAPANDTAAPAVAPVMPEAVAPAPAATTPAQPAPSMPDGDRDLAKWDGYDALTFGMDEAAFRRHWGGALKKDDAMEGSTCFHMYPAWTTVPAEFAFMFEEGVFARYSTESATFIAPGGGKVGMSRAEIDALYGRRIEEQAHKYTDGKYLRIRQGANVLIFETDASGTVTEWRVGVPPQVDYVEGCS